MLTDKSEQKREQTIMEHQRRRWRSTWCNFSCQKYSPGKRAQHPAQLSLGSIQHWGMHPGEVIPKADCSQSSPLMSWESPQQ